MSKTIYPRLPEAFRSIMDDASQPLSRKLVKMMAESLRPKPEQDDPRTKAAEQSLHEFSRQAWHVLEPNNPFVDGWHIGCVAAHLEAVTALEIRNIIINIPPRHAKSLVASVMWFVWSWIRNPASRWLFTSYASTLSVRDSGKCRTLIRSPWFQSRWGNVFSIKAVGDTQTKFINTHEGYRIATSTRGVGTGEGGDYVVADDPHKTDEALSDLGRAMALRNWNETMSTRGNNPDTMCKVIIMQRLHERDLTGSILAEGRDYEHLCLPAEYEPKRYFFPQPGGSFGGASGRPGAASAPVKAPRDSITPTSLQRANPALQDNEHGSGRKEDGEPLWPQRFGPKQLATLKGELGARGTAGQLAQRPNPSEGNIFQEGSFRYFDEERTRAGLRFTMRVPWKDPSELQSFMASECRWFQCCDTALTLNSTSAWTVVGTFFVTPSRQLGVWDIWRNRVPVAMQYKCLMQLRDGLGDYDPVAFRWNTPGLANPWPSPLMYQAVEDKASGIGLIQQAAMEGRPFRVLKAGSGGAGLEDAKVRRAAPLATLFEAGCVYFREAARPTWLTDYQGELLNFPGGHFADQVDVTSYAASLLTMDALTFAKIDGELLVDGGGSDSKAIEPGGDVCIVHGDIVVDFRDDGAWWRS